MVGPGRPPLSSCYGPHYSSFYTLKKHPNPQNTRTSWMRVLAGARFEVSFLKRGRRVSDSNASN
jgi:hypothetical protein